MFSMKSNLVMFTGTDCPHCAAMEPLVAKLSYDTGIVLDQRDVWANEADFRIYENYQNQVRTTDPDCQGLPFFMNTDTGEYLCGEVNYKELKGWALKKQ